MDTVKMRFDIPPIGRTGTVEVGIAECLDKLPGDVQHRIMIPLYAGIELLRFRFIQHVLGDSLPTGTSLQDSTVCCYELVGCFSNFLVGVYNQRDHAVVAANHPGGCTGLQQHALNRLIRQQHQPLGVFIAVRWRCDV